MRKLMVILLIVVLAGCTTPQERTIEITPVVPLEENVTPQVPVVIENDTVVPPKVMVDETAAKQKATDLCLDETEFKLETVCMDDAGLRVKIENKGTNIDHFEVKVRDLFENEFYSVGTVQGLKEDQTASVLISREAFDAIPYRVQIKPVIVVGTVEFPCTPATEVFDAGDREEFRDC